MTLGAGDQLPKKKSTKIGKYIRSSVTIRDSTQVEAVFDFILRPKKSSPSDLLRNHRYSVEAIFFFPKQMQVSPRTFPKQEFLNDIRPFIRLQEPKFSFSELIGDSADSAGQAPLKKLQTYIAGYQTGNAQLFQTTVVDEARLFACSFKRHFHRRNRRCCRSFREPMERKPEKNSGKYRPDSENLAQFAEDLLADAWRLLNEFRKLGRTLESFGDNALVDLQQEFKYVDEYCTYQFRYFLAQIANEISTAPGVLKLQTVIKLRSKISAWSRLERYHSRRSRYLWADRASSEDEAEEFFERQGMLKYRIWSVLLLAARTEPLFAFRLQVGKMVAAGLAAIWALVANIYILQLFQLGGTQAFNFSNIIGATGFLLITASVFSYILKDRIKEIGRERLDRGLLGKLPATHEKIRYSDSQGRQITLGSIKEFGDYLGDRIEGEDISKLRVSRFRHLPNGRNHIIFRYQKMIEISGKSLASHSSAIFGLQDVLRLNISRFTDRLDNPKESYLSIDRSGETSFLNLPRNYSIDLLIRHSRRNRKGADLHVASECYRLVINKSGIVRIDQPGGIEKTNHRPDPEDPEFQVLPIGSVDLTEPVGDTL
jgi:hypothetical protein